MTTTPAHAEKPDWMDGWKPDAAPKKVGNPNWYPGMPSPNKSGRPRGIVDKRVRVAQQMLDDVQGIVEVMTAKALEGDSAAASLILGRVLPSLRSQAQPVAFEFDATAPIARQVEMVLDGIASGAVPADIGKQIIDAVGALSAIRATEELEARLAALEAKEERS